MIIPLNLQNTSLFYYCKSNYIEVNFYWLHLFISRELLLVIMNTQKQEMFCIWDEST